MSSTPPSSKSRRKRLQIVFSNLFSSKSSSTIVADNYTGQSTDTNLTAPSSDAAESLTRISASTASIYQTILADPTPSLSKSSRRVKNIRNAGFEGLKTTLKLLQVSSDVFPPLKSTIAVLSGVIELVEATFQNQQFRDDLQRKLGAVVSMIENHYSLSNSDAFNSRLGGLLIAINNQLSAIHIQNQRSFSRRLAAGDESQQISIVYRTISYLFDAFQMDTALASERKVEEVQSHLWFDKLPQAEYAEYDARSPAQRHACTADTRKAILAELVAWTVDIRNSNIYWLNGMAGTGKTTIAYTFSEILEKNQMLGATFFCYRQDNSGDAGLIFPTIAHQLARRIPAAFRMIVDVIQSDPQIGSRSILRQFQDLIFKPLIAASGYLAPRPFIIIIEALDECTNQGFVTDIISIICQHASLLPVKFFITSRPERWIRQSFNRRDFENPLKLILHEVEKDLVSADIELYTRARLADIADGRDDEGPYNDWPSESDVKTLIHLAGNLFIYAATICEYISEGSIRERLSAVTNISAGTKKGETAALDALYSRILTAAYAPANSKEKQDIILTLHAVVSIFQPLSIQALGELLNVSVRASLSGLHSLIYIPSSQNSNAPISALHASFPDYISDKDRAGGELWLDPIDSHRYLALHCLTSLQISLKDIIPHLHGRHREHIPESLGYACAYWVSHVTETPIDDSEADSIYLKICDFLDKNMLQWIDCLSILGQLEMAVTALRKLEKWAQCEPILLRDITDARVFITENFEYIKHHSLETHSTALIWLPEQSSIRKKYTSERDCLWKLMLGMRKTWHACEAVLVGHSSTVTSVVFSPNGTHIVSASNDKTIRIWNAMTGGCEAILNGHSASVNSVAFSYDGSRIASASDDNTIRIWSAPTWESQVELTGHSDRVKSVVFSPNGSYIASASYDNTIVLWSLAGKYQATLHGHSDRVNSVVFSPDSSKIISASDDKTIIIWNAVTGESEAQLEGHSASVNSVVFSPDGSHIVSGSDDNTIQIWNVTTGKSEAELKGHSGWIHSVTFSPDGSRIASAAYDSTVHIWNATTGHSEGELKGHSASVNSVMYSPDGSCIASASYDNTVRIWNVAMTLESAEESYRHSTSVKFVIFSPDGNHVASASDDNTILVWNTTKGRLQAELNGHSDRINSVIFSPDSSRIASASDDGTACIWNATTGESEAELKGHATAVNYVLFSPDGRLVASASDDKTVFVWNAMSGETNVVLMGHSSRITSIAFSPNGKHIASGSYDETVRLWDATTGAAKAELKGHNRWVYSVVFSLDGSRVASASYDNAVRIWNAVTGEFQAELKGHNVQVESIMFSADGSHLVALALASRTPYIWDTITGRREPPESLNTGFPPSIQTIVKHLVIADDQWIYRLKDNTQPEIRDVSESCWIPPPFRNPRAIAYHNSKVCFGYHTGEVMVVEFTRDS